MWLGVCACQYCHSLARMSLRLGRFLLQCCSVGLVCLVLVLCGLQGRIFIFDIADTTVVAVTSLVGYVQELSWRYLFGTLTNYTLTAVIELVDASYNSWENL